MGVVYRARDVSLSRDVAIKALSRVSHVGVRRLRREARAAARLIHPNLGLIFAAEAWRGTPMLVLEFLDGGTLDDRIDCGPIAASDIVAWGVQLAGALEAAHAMGILHRDIKPSNIGFTTGGSPKLLDFGLARLLDDPASGAADGAPSGPLSPLALLGTADGSSFTLTASGRVVGTVPYLSPEAVRGEPPAPGFDIWGLTLSLYEALTGQNPFAVGHGERAMNLILSERLPDPRGLRPNCPEALAAFFEGALAKSPAGRPATARELRERFEALQL
jgi:serine/threonine-protein kinase